MVELWPVYPITCGAHSVVRLEPMTRLLQCQYNQFQGPSCCIKYFPCWTKLQADYRANFSAALSASLWNAIHLSWQV